jgi:beta-lactamase class A
VQEEDPLRKQIEEKAAEAEAEAVAVSVYDYETDTAWSYHGNQWFHAASTIKVAVLAALFHAADSGKYHPRARLHVRNWFISRADGKPYRIASSRDANTEVHAAIGKTMRLEELAYHMIVTSSNLATNLLVDLLGVDEIRDIIQRVAGDGIDFQRGVEDERAYEADLNNQVTADGLVRLFRAIYEEREFSQESSQKMLDILFKQEFTSGIPAGFPDNVRKEAKVAHKTGEISTISHDCGLVFLPNRKPYAIAVLTQWAPDQSGRRDCIADLSRLVYNYVTDQDTVDV